MYILAKLAQAAGLAVIGIGFVTHYPHLMSAKIFYLGIVLFIFGWIVQRFMLRR